MRERERTIKTVCFLSFFGNALYVNLCVLMCLRACAVVCAFKRIPVFCVCARVFV